MCVLAVLYIVVLPFDHVYRSRNHYLSDVFVERNVCIEMVTHVHILFE